MAEEVILVNEFDEPLGIMDKMQAHREGVLHRAFSVFIFNSSGEILLQQRALDKYHSAGLWTNSCCSHPGPGESVEVAAHRRLKEELGFDTELFPAFNFVYNSEFENGLTEHEYDHVFTGIYDGEILPSPAEVYDVKFMKIPELKLHIEKFPVKYTSWFKIALPRLLEKLNYRESDG